MGENCQKAKVVKIAKEQISLNTGVDWRRLEELIDTHHDTFIEMQYYIKHMSSFLSKTSIP